MERARPAEMQVVCSGTAGRPAEVLAQSWRPTATGTICWCSAWRAAACPVGWEVARVTAGSAGRVPGSQARRAAVAGARDGRARHRRRRRDQRQPGAQPRHQRRPDAGPRSSARPTNCTAARRAYRGDRPPVDMAGKTVILVDDGIATGASMLAAVRAVRADDPAAVVVAVPVGPPSACRELATRPTTWCARRCRPDSRPSVRCSRTSTRSPTTRYANCSRATANRTALTA